MDLEQAVDTTRSNPWLVLQTLSSLCCFDPAPELLHIATTNQKQIPKGVKENAPAI